MENEPSDLAKSERLSPKEIAGSRWQLAPDSAGVIDIFRDEMVGCQLWAGSFDASKVFDKMRRRFRADRERLNGGDFGILQAGCNREVVW